MKPFGRATRAAFVWLAVAGTAAAQASGGDAKEGAEGTGFYAERNQLAAAGAGEAGSCPPGGDGICEHRLSKWAKEATMETSPNACRGIGQAKDCRGRGCRWTKAEEMTAAEEWTRDERRRGGCGPWPKRRNKPREEAKIGGLKDYGAMYMAPRGLYTWQIDRPHAAESMRFAIFPAYEASKWGLRAAENDPANAETLRAVRSTPGTTDAASPEPVAPCVDVPFGTMMPPEIGRCYRLLFDPISDISVFFLSLLEGGAYAIFLDVVKYVKLRHGIHCANEDRAACTFGLPAPPR